MVRLHTVLILMLLLAFASCKQSGEEGEKSVTVETSGIEEPVSIYLNGVLINSEYDLDEYVKGGDPLVFTVKVKNNSKFKIFDLDLQFSEFSITNYNFSTNDAGLKQFPGKNGTCDRTLLSGQSCTIELQFTSIVSGQISQNIIISYKNLLQEDSKQFSLTILSGTPASLLFDPNENNFTFGAPTGAAGKPLLEREYRVTETKVLTVKNFGELRARNIVPTLNQTCKSYLDNTCPAPPNPGDIAYEWENINCPNVLYAGESCQVRVSLTNWNQGSNPHYKEITFQSTLKFDYGKDPLGNTAALNGNFFVISTNIEARFESSLSSLVFEEVLTVGNRDSRTFRAKNTGYQAGILRKFIFYPAGSSTPAFYCQKESSPMLACYHMDDTPAVLNDLPFFIEDKETCMSSANDILIPDTSGCLFTLYFQPSNLKMVGGTEEYDIRFEYDSLFLNQQTIVQNSFVDIFTEGEYRAAAKLAVTGFNIEGMDIPFNRTDVDGVPGYDFGRWTLMLKDYYEKVNISFTFTNQGETVASNTTGMDGSGNSILMAGTNPITSFTPSAYQSLSLPSSTCSNILPGQSCVLSMKFSAIYRDATECTPNDVEECVHQSLFDFVESYKSPNNYKLFKLEYDNGAKYTDANITSTTQDMDRKEVATKMYGIPVTAGKLGEYRSVHAVDPSDPGDFIGEVLEKTFLVRNIGTGTIPYIRAFGMNNCTGAPSCPAENDNHHFEYLPTDPALLSTYSAEDCLDIINWQDDNVYDDRGDLLVEEACLFTVRMQYQNHFYDTQTWEDTATNPLSVFWKKSLLGTNYMYSLNPTEGDDEVIAYFRWVYFNGDGDNPNKDGWAYDLNLAATYTHLGDPAEYHNGLRYMNSDDEPRVVFRESPHLVPTLMQPVTSALLYREEFTRDALLDYAGNSLAGVNPAKTFPEVWVYGSTDFFNFDITGATPALEDANPDYTYAWKSIGAARANIGLCSDCDYQIHLGAFPAGQAIKFGFSLQNLRASTSGKISGLNFTGDPEFTFDPSPMLNSVVAGTTFAAFTGSFTGTADELNYGTFYYTVDNNIGTGTWTYKVLITAKSVANAPFLTFDQQRYDVTTYDPETFPGTPPDEVLDTGSTTAVTGTINNDAVTGTLTDSNSVTLEMVKLENVDTNTGYIKKRINITNASTAYSMNNFHYYFRNAVTQDTPHDMGAVIGFSSSTNCTTSLATNGSAGDSCYIDLKYQPNIFAAGGNYYLTFVYEVESNRFIKQNILVSLSPLDPSNLTMVGYGAPQEVALPGDNVTTGYRIDFGEVTLDQLPKVLSYGPIDIANDSASLRASFLKSYREFLGDPNAANPTTGSGTDFSGEEFFKIYETTKVEVYANNECFVGEDPSGVEEYEKGFLEDGVTKCQLMVNLSLDINTAAKILDKASADDMNGFVVFLPYYSFQRINVNSLKFFFTGTIKPDEFTSGGNAYNIIGKDNRTISFEFIQGTANNPGVGDIAGYRVYYSDNTAAFNNVLTSPTPHLPDMYESVSSLYAQFDQGIDFVERGKFYYFKIVAIRQNANYTAGNFPGLPAGYFLSDGDMPIVRVMVPKFGHSYIYSLDAMVKKDVEGGGAADPMTYADALMTCGSLNTTITENGVTKNKTYKLITAPIWNSVKYSVEDTNYSSWGDPLSLPHWIGPSIYDVANVFASNPYFDPGESSQCFADDKSCYLKCEDGCAADRMVVGGFYGYPSAVDYTSYLGETFPLGHARCYIDVAP